LITESSSPIIGVALSTYLKTSNTVKPLKTSPTGGGAAPNILQQSSTRDSYKHFENPRLYAKALVLKMLFRLLRFMDYDEVYGLAEGLA
jgi:hypothetical protein